MKITIKTKGRNASNALQLIKFLRGSVGFKTIGSNLEAVVMQNDAVTDYDLSHIKEMIKHYRIVCAVNFNA